MRGEVGRFEDEYQLTSVAYANDGNTVYTGGIDNCVTAWDVRQMHKSMTMKGHTGELGPARTSTCPRNDLRQLNTVMLQSRNHVILIMHVLLII